MGRIIKYFYTIHPGTDKNSWWNSLKMGLQTISWLYLIHVFLQFSLWWRWNHWRFFYLPSWDLRKKRHIGDTASSPVKLIHSWNERKVNKNVAIRCTSSNHAHPVMIDSDRCEILGWFYKQRYMHIQLVIRQALDRDIYHFVACGSKTLTIEAPWQGFFVAGGCLRYGKTCGNIWICIYIYMTCRGYIQSTNPCIYYIYR